jgi:TP901-1 family phage major tail protein
MRSYSGALLLLKIQDQKMNYITIGGMRATKFSLNNQLIDASNKSTGKWRYLLEEAGISSVNISGSGIFTGSEAEQLIRNVAFKGVVSNYQINFASGDSLEGGFYIINYERSGNYNEEELYHMTLESSGEVKYLYQLT